jgi:hypothetical protein
MYKKLDSDGNLRIRCIGTSNAVNDTGDSFTIPPEIMLEAWKEYQNIKAPMVLQHTDDEKSDIIIGYVESMDFSPRDWEYTSGIPKYLAYEFTFVLTDTDAIKQAISYEKNGVSMGFLMDWIEIDPTHKIATKLKIEEFSLVTVPANPDCYFNIQEQSEIEEESYGIGEEVMAFGRPFRLRDIVDKSFFLESNGQTYITQASELSKLGYCAALLDTQFTSWIGEIIDKEDVIKWEHSPHITLLYGLKAPAIPSELLDDKIKIRGCLIFEQVDRDILVMELSKSEDLLEAREELEQNEFEKGFDFLPHVTIAEFKKGEAKKYVEDIEQNIPNWIYPEEILTYVYSDGINKLDSIKDEYYSLTNVSLEELENYYSTTLPSYALKKTIALMKDKENWSTDDYNFAKNVINKIKEDDGSYLMSYGYKI